MKKLQKLQIAPVSFGPLNETFIAMSPTFLHILATKTIFSDMQRTILKKYIGKFEFFPSTTYISIFYILNS